MVVVDKVKTPKLYEFLEKNIAEIMEHIQADFKKMEVYYKNQEGKDPNQIEPYKAQIPVAYVTLKEFHELQEGLKEKPVKAMTFCFSNTRLLCDIRVQKEDMIRQHLQKLHEAGFSGKPTVDASKNNAKAPLRLILPDEMKN
jgi:hypothetical protein